MATPSAKSTGLTVTSAQEPVRRPGTAGVSHRSVSGRNPRSTRPDRADARPTRERVFLGRGTPATRTPFVFEPGETILEIGAGSGRDAVRLQALGAKVDAVEPSAGLRQLALATHPELSGRVHDGFLPGGLPREIREKYDGILLSAVIMRIPDAELFDTAFTLRERLTKGGKLLVSMPVDRGDVSPDSDRDSQGRLMIIPHGRAGEASLLSGLGSICRMK